MKRRLTALLTTIIATIGLAVVGYAAPASAQNLDGYAVQWASDVYEAGGGTNYHNHPFTSVTDYWAVRVWTNCSNADPFANEHIHLEVSRALTENPSYQVWQNEGDIYQSTSGLDHAVGVSYFYHTPSYTDWDGGPYHIQPPFYVKVNLDSYTSHGVGTGCTWWYKIYKYTGCPPNSCPPKHAPSAVDSVRR